MKIKLLLIELIKGSSKAFETLKGIIIQRINKQKRFDLEAESIVSDIWEYFRKKDLDNISDKEVEKMFYLKLSNIFFTGKETEARIIDIKERVISASKLVYKGKDGEIKIPINDIKRLFYIIFRSGNCKNANVVFQREQEVDCPAIILKATPEFCEFVTKGIDPVEIIERDRFGEQQNVRISKLGNTFRFRKISKPRKQVSIKHKDFSSTTQDTIKLDIEKINAKKTKELLSLLCVGDIPFEIMSITGFEDLAQQQISLDNFAKYFSYPQLFTEKCPGRLFIVYYVKEDSPILLDENRGKMTPSTNQQYEKLETIEELKKLDQYISHSELPNAIKKEISELTNKYKKLLGGK